MLLELLCPLAFIVTSYNIHVSQTTTLSALPLITRLSPTKFLKWAISLLSVRLNRSRSVEWTKKFAPSFSQASPWSMRSRPGMHAWCIPQPIPASLDFWKTFATAALNLGWSNSKGMPRLHERSCGPMRVQSTPGTARRASRLSSAFWDSMFNTTIFSPFSRSK